MKELKSKRLVTFSAVCSSWSDASDHTKAVAVARKLNETQFSGTVLSTELPPLSKESTEDRVRYSESTYYKTDAPILVSEEEYLELKKIGVRDLKVLGIYAENMTHHSEILFYIGVAAFAVWNFALMVKFLGIL